MTSADDMYATDRLTADVMELAGTVHVLEDTVTRLAGELRQLAAGPPPDSVPRAHLAGPSWNLRTMTPGAAPHGHG